MRLGMIARADNSGLGIQTYEFARHMKPQKTLVINVGHLANTTSHCNKSTHLDRFPGSIVHRGWEPSAKTIATFLDGLDVVASQTGTFGLLPGVWVLAKQLARFP